jgi:hypothetical protein
MPSLPLFLFPIHCFYSSSCDLLVHLPQQALGLIDAGGRNATISLTSDSGFVKMGAVVGMAVFAQFWYWFPVAGFISLAIKPTAIIAVNR